MIFQPVQFPEILREYLIKNNFEIIDEDMVEDDEIIYSIILSKKKSNSTEEKWDDMDFEFGKINIENKHPLFLRLLDKKINSQEKIIHKLKGLDKERIKERLDEVNNLLQKYKELKNNVTFRNS